MSDSPHSILIVDDDESMLFGFRIEFEMEGFKVDTATNLSHALDAIRQHRYSAVITDLNLREKQDEDGVLVLKAVTVSHKSTKTVMISGSGEAGVKEKAIASGAQFFFEKPVSAQTLLDLLK